MVIGILVIGFRSLVFVFRSVSSGRFESLHTATPDGRL